MSDVVETTVIWVMQFHLRPCHSNSVGGYPDRTDFDRCQGSSSVNFPPDISGFFVTLSDSSDHSITFSDFVILLDYISHLTLGGLELKSLASGPP